MASWTKRLRKNIKRIGRKRIAKHEKYVTRWARPVVATGLSYLYGPAVGAAFTAGTHHLHQYAASTGARYEGKRGLDARRAGRKQAQRTTLYSAYGVGLGTFASGVTAAVTGGNVLTQAAAGQHGAQILNIQGAGGAFGPETSYLVNQPGGPRDFALAAAPASAKSGATTAATSSSLSWQMVNGVPAYAPAGVGTPMAGTSATLSTAGGSSLLSTLGQVGTGLATAAGGAAISKVLGANILPDATALTGGGGLNNAGSGGDDIPGGGYDLGSFLRGSSDASEESNPLVPALIIGGLLLMSR